MREVVCPTFTSYSKLVPTFPTIVLDGMRISHDGMDPRSLGTSPVAWPPLAVVSPCASLARLAADFAMRPLAVVEAVPASDAERSALAAFRAELIAEEIGIPNSMSANGGETGVLLRFLARASSTSPRRLPCSAKPCARQRT